MRRLLEGAGHRLAELVAGEEETLAVGQAGSVEFTLLGVRPVDRASARVPHFLRCIGHNAD